MRGDDLRLPEGGDIDRSRPLNFRFDGRWYRGYAGDTLASALLANGVRMVGRSFKYHRPRGIMTAGSEEPNALVQLRKGARTEPNVRATQIELFDGLEAESQNRWPSLKFDVGAVNNALGRLFPAGFYYKTFMWPKGFWETYEVVIRHAAGMGRSPEQPDPDRYDKMHAHCDVLVVGGGPAGLAAARAAAAGGARVILADEQPAFGGSLLGNGERIDDAPGADWAASVVDELQDRDNVRLLPRTTVIGYHDHNYLTAVERVADHLAVPPPHRPRQRLWKIRAKRVVLATGAIERPLVFADNDRPGVMLASAAQCYLHRYSVRPGRRAVVFTNNDSAYGVALDMADAGITVAAIVDLRPDITGAYVDRAREAGIAIYAGEAVVGVYGARGVTAVDVQRLDDGGTAVVSLPRRLECELLAISGGWNPTVHLFSQSGGRLRFDQEKSAFVPDASRQAERSVGAANGDFDLAACLAEGAAAGAAASGAAGAQSSGLPTVDALPESTPMRPLWLVPGKAALGRGAKHFVDFQNDVTAADLNLAAREGYRSIEHVKRYTTTGMGTDQGKTSNVNALAIVAGTLGVDIEAVGTTTFRPPYTPASFSAFAGRDHGDFLDPERKTPMHAWHVTNGAVFEPVGQWLRPRYYQRGEEDMHAAVARECKATRHSLGVLDATTLGKIDIQGPDAAEFLNRIYINGWSKLGVGRCRYGLMLHEDGMVFDDGVTTRLAEQHFHMTTTTGNAAAVLGWLENWLQTEWPDLKVYCNSVTEQWAVASIGGPNARKLLAELSEGIELDNEAFPFMSLRMGRVAGIPARVFRISFSGELSYEINVPASYGLALWQALMTAGEKYAITPYGTEAMHVLRAEAGFIIVGQETDGTVTPVDLGMDAMVSRKKDFIGKRSLSRSDTARPDRKQLVGLLTEDPDLVVPEGAQVIGTANPKPPEKMLGHVTSSYHSPNVGRSIALGLVSGGGDRHGERVHLFFDDQTVPAKIAPPRFFDAEGARARG